jgi:hypothetical protein
MKTLQFLFNRSGLLLVMTGVSLCTSGCVTPLVALGSSAAGAGMQALGSATGAAGIKVLGDAAGAVGMQILGDKVVDAMGYMQGGEQVADVTYWTRPALLKTIVDQTLRETVSSSFIALQYSQESEGLFVLSTSTGNELQILVKEDSSFEDLHATQMIVAMETVEVASEKTETSEFVNVLEEIDSKTQRWGIEPIRGDFDYAAVLSAYDSEPIQQPLEVAQQQ